MYRILALFLSFGLVLAHPAHASCKSVKERAAQLAVKLHQTRFALQNIEKRVAEIKALLPQADEADSGLLQQELAALISEYKRFKQDEEELIPMLIRTGAAIEAECE